MALLLFLKAIVVISDEDTQATPTSDKKMSAESVHLVQLPSFSELLSTLPSDQATSTPLPPGEIFHRPTSSSLSTKKVYLFPVRRLLEETATRLVVDGNDVAGCALGWMGEAELDGGRKTKRRRMSRSRSRDDQNVSWTLLSVQEEPDLSPFV